MNGKTISIRRENVGEKLKVLLDGYEKFKILFPKEQTNCLLVGSKNNHQKTFLRIVFHWKNIAQGIKTPCLNIFDES